MRPLIAMLLLLASFVGVWGLQGETNPQTPKNKPQPNRSVLSISLQPKHSSFTFLYPNPFTEALTLKSRSSGDTTIIQNLHLDKPTLFVNIVKNIVMSHTGSIEIAHAHPILLNPGDSIFLRDTAPHTLVVERSTGYPDFIDSLMTIPDNFFWHSNGKHQRSLDSIGLTGMVQRAEAIFNKNEAAIARLNLPAPQMAPLNALNRNIKYTTIARSLYHASVPRSKLTDSLYEDMVQHLDVIYSVNMASNTDVMHALIAYSGTADGDYKSRPWEYAATADPRIKQTEAFKDLLAGRIAGHFKEFPKETEKLWAPLQSLRSQDGYLDTLYQLTEILRNAFTDFKQANADLNVFADGRFYFIFEGNEQAANHEMKTIRDLPPIAVYTLDGVRRDLKQLIADTDYQLTVVDLWASWCIPCIAEMPHWDKAKTKLADSPIQFLTLSIDKDEDTAKWIAAAKEHGLDTDPDQYRLAGFRESPLTNLLNIQQIPRYLVINNQGDVIDGSFHKPSTGRFELELIKLLN